MNIPLVSIIIVNWNGKAYLKDCFDSLRNLNYSKKKTEIIMIDNCSRDGSIEFVRKTFPEVKIIKNTENNYCKANNLGIRRSHGKFIAFLNNDTIVDKEWLMELIKVIQKDKKIAGVGSKILFSDKKTIQSVGHKKVGDFHWIDEGFGEKNDRKYNKIKKMESLCGASALYKMDYLKKIDLFDEEFNMYYEDVDISIRLKKIGLKLLYAPKSIVYHKFRGTINSYGGERKVNEYAERNRMLLIAKSFPEKMLKALKTAKLPMKKEYLELIGERWFDSYKIDKKKIITEMFKEIKKIPEKNEEIRQKNEEIRQKNEAILNLKKQLEKIKTSRGWKFLTDIHKTKKALRIIK